MQFYLGFSAGSTGLACSSFMSLLRHVFINVIRSGPVRRCLVVCLESIWLRMSASLSVPKVVSVNKRASLLLPVHCTALQYMYMNTQNFALCSNRGFPSRQILERSATSCNSTCSTIAARCTVHRHKDDDAWRLPVHVPNIVARHCPSSEVYAL
jgi:hypothetical protein